jgi:hypothetical protein
MFHSGELASTIGDRNKAKRRYSCAISLRPYLFLFYFSPLAYLIQQGAMDKEALAKGPVNKTNIDKIEVADDEA